uniref:Uncharacterized protein n=1 Tax=Caenorhabditis japonica TaxID=281687 RepID=A0A8R1I824_CAEJA
MHGSCLRENVEWINFEEEIQSLPNGDAKPMAEEWTVSQHMSQTRRFNLEKGTVAEMKDKTLISSTSLMDPRCRIEEEKCDAEHSTTIIWSFPYSFTWRSLGIFFGRYSVGPGSLGPRLFGYDGSLGTATLWVPILGTVSLGTATLWVRYLWVRWIFGYGIFGYDGYLGTTIRWVPNLGTVSFGTIALWSRGGEEGFWTKLPQGRTFPHQNCPEAEP